MSDFADHAAEEPEQGAPQNAPIIGLCWSNVSGSRMS